MEEHDTTDRVTLRGEIDLNVPVEPKPVRLTLMEFAADGSFCAPTSFAVRLEGSLRQLARLCTPLPALAPLFPDLGAHPADAHGLVDLIAPPALVARIAAAKLPEDARFDLDKLLGHEAWCRAAFDVASYEAHGVGVRTSHEVTDSR